MSYCRCGCKRTRHYYAEDERGRTSEPCRDCDCRAFSGRKTVVAMRLPVKGRKRA